MGLQQRRKLLGRIHTRDVQACEVAKVALKCHTRLGIKSVGTLVPSRVMFRVLTMWGEKCHSRGGSGLLPPAILQLGWRLSSLTPRPDPTPPAQRSAAGPQDPQHPGIIAATQHRTSPAGAHLQAVRQPPALRDRAAQLVEGQGQILRHSKGGVSLRGAPGQACLAAGRVGGGVGLCCAWGLAPHPPLQVVTLCGLDATGNINYYSTGTVRTE